MAEKEKVFWNTQHSPIGAFASFTLGAQGATGGLAMERGGPACDSFWIGAEGCTGEFHCLPFFQDEEKARLNYVQDQPVQTEDVALYAMDETQIERTLTLTGDHWQTPYFDFDILTQASHLPNPELEDSDELQQKLIPAVLCRFVVDNSASSETRKVFFAWQSSEQEAMMRCICTGRGVGVAMGTRIGIFGLEHEWEPMQGFSCQEMLQAYQEGKKGLYLHGIGPIGALVGSVAAGEKKSLSLLVCFYKGEPATVDHEYHYWYTRWFKSLEEVAAYGLKHQGVMMQESLRAQREFNVETLSEERQWMLAQAVHSYYGSTQLLSDQAGDLFWIVNEGEYKMMNTMDLMVDQIFFELRLHPWTVRSVLNLYDRRYSYSDSMGRLFCHDMGVANVWSPRGKSSYEQPWRQGCFSYMCQEELVNWILSAAVYTKSTNDIDWLLSRQDVFRDCTQSLLQRDHSDRRLAKGVLQRDSDLCQGGYEITTYDSLDSSLGRACGSTYLAVKTWAAWVALCWNYEQWDRDKEAALCDEMAQKAQATILQAFDAEKSLFSADLAGQNAAAVLPVAEGLLVPWILLGPSLFTEGQKWFPLYEAIHDHMQMALLTLCRFENGAWKLSESSNHSWLSKIYLLQAITEQILNIQDPRGAEADGEYVHWLKDPQNHFWAWSDQMDAGRVCGSRYYPRGVTSILWLPDPELLL